MNDDDFQKNILNTMDEKYENLVDFNLEINDTITAKKAYNEWSRFKEVHTDFNYHWTMENMSGSQKEIFEQLNLFKIDFSEIKNQKRLSLQSKKIAREIFEKGNYNMEMYNYAMTQYFKKKKALNEREIVTAEKKEGSFGFKAIGSGIAIGAMFLVGITMYTSPFINMAMR